jgi:glycosyltransferase involved in cell wall biosynthesis
MARTPEVAVAVPTHNRHELLAQLLASLEEQSLPRSQFEVVVVDDGSSDGTPELLREESERGELELTTIRHDTPAGPAAARNAAWRAARAPLVAFTDDDCVATPEWLRAGLEAHRAHPGAVVQGRTAPRPDQLHRHSPFSRTQLIEGAGPLFETCNVFYPRELLERLDGFADDVYKLPAGEDTDLAWRALEQGATAEYAPEALVHHEVLVAGPVGMLKSALRWHTAIPVFARHPGLRRAHLRHGVFWSVTHEQLLLFAAGLALRRLPRPLRLLLCLPYLERLVRRRTGPLLAPYLIVLDLVEMGSVVSGAVRSRVLVL